MYILRVENQKEIRDVVTNSIESCLDCLRTTFSSGPRNKEHKPSLILVVLGLSRQTPFLKFKSYIVIFF